MVNSMRVFTLITFGLVLVMLPAPNVQAQACGGSFNLIEVSDPEGKSIRDATIELVARLPEEEYYATTSDEGAGIKLSVQEYIKMIERRLPVKRLLGGAVIKVLAKDAEKIIKRKLPMYESNDRCGNPLAQIANLTKLKIHPEYLSLKVHPSGNHEIDFGFCTLENYHAPFLLKVSAPDYLTEYYAGHYLGGCGRTYKFVLTKKGKIGKPK
jgi:hypothetical protein